MTYTAFSPVGPRIAFAVDGVVFPTGVDRRDDVGRPDRIDVYYGMADDRMGVGPLMAPETLG
jgi:predicted GH43/DUF377 family glycosyl hydrolase